MIKLNKAIIKAGLCHLINGDKASFIDKLSLVIQSKPDLLDFLFDGPIPINDDIRQKIENHIKLILPCSDYFKGIESIDIDFNYDLKQRYYISYNVIRFYDQDKKPWNGNPTKDDNHPIEIVTKQSLYLEPNEIKI